MKFLINSKKRFLLIFIPLILLTILILTPNKPNSVQNTTFFPTPTPVRSGNSQAKPPSYYLKTTIGRTSENEVKKIGNPKSTKTLPNGEKEYHFQSPNNLMDNIILIKNNLVIFEKEITSDNTYTHPKISTFLNALGKPEREITGSLFYGKFEKYYIFASKGITVVGNPFTGEIDEIHAYYPMTVENYIKNFGSDINPSQDNKESF